MAEENKKDNELQNTSNSNSNNGAQINPMQLVQTKPLTTIVQFSEDQVKKSDGKGSGN